MAGAREQSWSSRICPATERGRGLLEDTGRLKALPGRPEHQAGCLTESPVQPTAWRCSLLQPGCCRSTWGAARGPAPAPRLQRRPPHVAFYVATWRRRDVTCRSHRGRASPSQPQAAGLDPAGTLQGTSEDFTPTCPRRDGRASPDWVRPTHTGKGRLLRSVCDLNGDLIHRCSHRHIQVSGSRLTP